MCEDEENKRGDKKMNKKSIKGGRNQEKEEGITSRTDHRQDCIRDDDDEDDAPADGDPDEYGKSLHQKIMRREEKNVKRLI